MIRFALAGAAVWAAERAVRWLVRDPYEPRHSVENQGSVWNLWVDRSSPMESFANRPQYVHRFSETFPIVPEANRKDFGRGMTLDELIGE